MELKLTYSEVRDLASRMYSQLAFDRSQIQRFEKSLAHLRERQEWLVEHGSSDKSLSELVSDGLLNSINSAFSDQRSKDPIALDIRARFHGTTAQDQDGLLELDPAIMIPGTPFAVHSIRRLAEETALVDVAIWQKQDTRRAVAVPADTTLAEVLDLVQTKISDHEKMIAEVESRIEVNQKKLNNANQLIGSFELGNVPDPAQSEGEREGHSKLLQKDRLYCLEWGAELVRRGLSRPSAYRKIEREALDNRPYYENEHDFIRAFEDQCYLVKNLKAEKPKWSGYPEFPIETPKMRLDEAERGEKVRHLGSGKKR